MASTPSQTEQQSPHLHEFLLSNCDDIVELWRKRAQEMPPARALSTRALTDYVPIILRRIAEVTRAREAGQSPDEARAHAGERLGRGYSLDEVVKEYGLLRQCILELWERDVGATVRIAELRALDAEIERYIAEAAERFSRERDRTLSALNEISEAAFGSRDLDVFFEHLLKAVLDAMEVTDTVEVFLRDGDKLCRRARRGFADALRPDVERIGDGLAGQIAAQRRPLSTDRETEHRAWDAGGGQNGELCTRYGVPLISGDDVTGVVVMGSRSAPQFSEDDKLLFETMVSRVNLVLQSALLQQRLSLSADRSEAILDAALDCVISMDDAGRVVGWNRAAEQTFGYQREQAIGAEMADLIIPPEQRAAHRRGVKHYLDTGEQRYFNRRLEFPAVRRDGSEFPVELTITRVPGERPIFTGFVRDISKEKQAERERQQLMEEVTRAAATQRLLADSSKRLSESLDFETTLALVPRLLVPDFADWCAVDVLEAGRLRRHSVVHAESGKAEFGNDLIRRYPLDPNSPHAAPQVLRTGETQLASHVTDELLVQIAHNDEHLGLLRSLGIMSYISTPITVRGVMLGVITVLRVESGRRYGTADVQVLEEIALRVATALENARLYREAQDAVQARENMLAVVSHDLRNPLGVIAISADALSMFQSRSGAGTNEQQISRIRRAVDRMGLLIDDLLDTASMQANRLSIDRQKTPLQPLLREILEAHEPAAEEAGIELEQRCDMADVEVFCDRHRVIQALSNLLGNAIKFCGAGDRISIDAQQQGSEVVISVADTGPGIAPEDLEHIFDPYWTVSNQEGSGTGLGLYIVRGIVEAHGGRTWVQSEVDRGATFFLTVPVATGR